MTREEAIQHIDALFPPDAPYPKTAEKGQELLSQAKRDVAAWKQEPTEVLVRFAQLCMDEDNRQTLEAMRGTQ